MVSWFPTKTCKAPPAPFACRGRYNINPGDEGRGTSEAVNSKRLWSGAQPAEERSHLGGETFQEYEDRKLVVASIQLVTHLNGDLHLEQAV